MSADLGWSTVVGRLSEAAVVLLGAVRELASREETENRKNYVRTWFYNVPPGCGGQIIQKMQIIQCYLKFLGLHGILNKVIVTLHI